MFFYFFWYFSYTLTHRQQQAKLLKLEFLLVTSWAKIRVVTRFIGYLSALWWNWRCSGYRGPHLRKCQWPDALPSCSSEFSCSSRQQSLMIIIEVVGLAVEVVSVFWSRLLDSQFNWLLFSCFFKMSHCSSVIHTWYSPQSQVFACGYGALLNLFKESICCNHICTILARLD
jgi:hypothetical protein